MNNRINRIHEKSLRLAYDDYELNFKLFLKKTTRRLFMIKICSYFLPKLTKEIFTEKNSCYNLRNIFRIFLSKPKINYYGKGSATYMGSKLLQELTNDIKISSSLAIFKKKIKT